MNTKTLALFSIGAFAVFCMLAVIPMEDTDATDISYTENVGAIPKAVPYTIEYTFGGSGYWNDQMKTAPSFTIRNNCTTTTPTYERIGSSYNWAWKVTFDLTPTYSGSFRCVMNFTTTGGFLSGDDTFSLMVTGSGLYNYTITYDANGGSGAPSTMTFTDASNSTSVTLSSTIPTKSTYSFLGWSESMNAVVPDYSAGGTYTFSAGTTNLYAVWDSSTPMYAIRCSQVVAAEGNGTMTVTVNGTSYTSNEEINIYVDAGSTVRFSYLATSGHHFVRWGYNYNNDYATTYYSTSNPLTLTINGNLGIFAQSEDDVPSFTYYFVSNNPSYGTVSQSSLTVSQSSTQVMAVNNILYTGTYGDTVTATPTASDSTYTYVFDGWYDSQNRKLGLYTYSSSETFTAKFTRQLVGYNVSFVADPNYGSFVPVSSVSVGYNTEIHVSGSTITINNIEVTAVANASDGAYSYSFSGWDVSEGDLITEDTTITATFTRSAISHITHWSNGMMNGRTTFVFAWPSENTEIHNMSMAFYNGTVNPDYTTTWTDTGYSLNISLSYPTTNFSFDLQNNGVSVKTDTVTSGKWERYELTIDAENGLVWMIPLRTFTSFNEYTTLDTQKTTLFDFSQYVTNTAIEVIDHEDMGAGDHVRFSVTNTDVFLNTYGVVMSNPAINVYNYFPQYDKVRLNFYAFALYGNALSINGAVFNVTDGRVTIDYVTDRQGNNILATLDPEATPETIKTKTLALNNIYVTWDGTRCTLTFQSDRFTVDLGSYESSNELVTFTGLWYFTSTIYEPHSVTGKELGEWKDMPDLDKNQMILIFLGILTVAGCGLYIKMRGGALDIVILAIAGILAFALLG